MPLYQFICPKCGTPYEIFMALSEKEDYDHKKIKGKRCPHCKKAFLKHIIGPVLFKI